MYAWRHPKRGLVLVVDDDAVFVAHVSNRLQKEGFHVISAPNVARAVRNTDRAMPRLVLLDIMLPDGTGIDVLHGIKKELSAHLPVIAMSSTCDPVMEQTALDAGAACFLMKPLNFDNLWPVMDRLLDRNSGAFTASREEAKEAAVIVEPEWMVPEIEGIDLG